MVNAEHLVLSEMLVQVSGQLPEGLAVLAKWLLNNDSCVPSPVYNHSFSTTDPKKVFLEVDD